eukprot:scaffold177905_cov21-Tisochrysis_lutea.AAC.2
MALHHSMAALNCTMALTSTTGGWLTRSPVRPCLACLSWRHCFLSSRATAPRKCIHAPPSSTAPEPFGMLPARSPDRVVRGPGRSLHGAVR